MECTNCGAPLPPKSNICSFCNTLNDTDLRAIHREAKSGPQTDRICPRCDVQLHSVDLQVCDGLVIERCQKCLGIFFDPGEVGALLDTSVSHVYEVDFVRLKTIVEQEGSTDFRQVTYVSCPVCRKLMNRSNNGSRSGVIVDECREHGIWLDGGELGRLLKWTKAGGQILTARRQLEEERAKSRKELAADTAPSTFPTHYGRPLDFEGSAIGGVLGFLSRLMR